MCEIARSVWPYALQITISLRFKKSRKKRSVTLFACLVSIVDVRPVLNEIPVLSIIVSHIESKWSSFNASVQRRFPTHTSEGVRT